MASQFQLVMRTGPTPGKTFELNLEEMTIGRDISNPIVINDAEVSRRHTRLRIQAGSYVVEDMGSTNGTFVNGQRLMGPHLLRPGEVIMLGEHVGFVFESTYDPNATMASGAQTYRVQPTPQTVQAPAPIDYPPPVYSGQAPQGPVDPYAQQAYEVPAPEQVYQEPPRQSRRWLYITCGALVIFACLCVGGLFLFDWMNLYCTGPFASIMDWLGFACP